MRTTLDIDPDILSAAKAIAAARKTTAGQVLSELARDALTRATVERGKKRNGFRLVARTGRAVTPELVDRLLEEDV